MNRRCLLAVLPLLLGAAIVPRPAAAQAAAFVSVISDLPVMPGLSEDRDAAMSFESAGGRIAEARAEGRLTAEDVRAFYRDTLPQLGWRGDTKNGFLRDDERLSVEISALSSGALSVTFKLRPAGE